METSVRVAPPSPFVPVVRCRFCDEPLTGDLVDRDGWKVCYCGGWHAPLLAAGDGMVGELAAWSRSASL